MEKDERMKEMETQMDDIVEYLKRAKERILEIATGLTEYERAISGLRSSLYYFEVSYFMRKGGKDDE